MQLDGWKKEVSEKVKKSARDEPKLSARSKADEQGMLFYLLIV